MLMLILIWCCCVFVVSGVLNVCVICLVNVLMVLLLFVLRCVIVYLLLLRCVMIVLLLVLFCRCEVIVCSMRFLVEWLSMLLMCWKLLSLIMSSVMGWSLCFVFVIMWVSLVCKVLWLVRLVSILYLVRYLMCLVLCLWMEMLCRIVLYWNLFVFC